MRQMVEVYRPAVGFRRIGELVGDIDHVLVARVCAGDARAETHSALLHGRGYAGAALTAQAAGGEGEEGGNPQEKTKRGRARRVFSALVNSIVGPLHVGSSSSGPGHASRNG